jgi:hypothetical protein
VVLIKMHFEVGTVEENMISWMIWHGDNLHNMSFVHALMTTLTKILQ